MLDCQAIEPVASLLELSINNICVLATSADVSSSTGSELCRQIVKSKPKQLVLYELSEFALYSIYRGLIAKVANN